MVRIIDINNVRCRYKMMIVIYKNLYNIYYNDTIYVFNKCIFYKNTIKLLVNKSYTAMIALKKEFSDSYQMFSEIILIKYFNIILSLQIFSKYVLPLVIPFGNIY